MSSLASSNTPMSTTTARSSFLYQVSISMILCAPPQQMDDPSARYLISEESWKHHAQARAILGNLIGPNGEQLTSTDPYNTTVFVGGLSPLISEDTLRTFFAPFGDIHYVCSSMCRSFTTSINSLHFRSRSLSANIAGLCNSFVRQTRRRRSRRAFLSAVAGSG